VKYDLVIFDLDGTLVDTFPWFLGVMNGVADKYRFRRVEEGELESLRRCSAREVMRRLKVPPWKLPFIAAHIRRLAHANTHQIPVFPGVPAMLQALKAAGVKVVVVSSNGEPAIRATLGSAAEMIDHCVGGVSVFGKAPKFARVMKKAGVRRERVLAVGDEVRDADAARKAGIDFGAVSWGMTHPEALADQQPAAMFARMEDITAQLTSRPHP
jgi:phosphoglycolate phosphatase